MTDIMTTLKLALFADIDAAMAEAFEAHARLKQLAEQERRELTQEYRDRIIETGGRLDG